MDTQNDEQSPLLTHSEGGQDPRKLIEFRERDEENPRYWSRSKKMVNVGIIALMAGP